jgi:hypothetical protein
MITFSINWFAVLVSLVVNMIIGALWYGPLFGKPWMKELGLTMEDVEDTSGMGAAYGLAIFNSFVMAFVLANVITWAGVSGVISGALLGLVIWVGFTGFTFATTHAFEGRSLRLWAINSGMYLAGLLVIGGILAGWQ